MNHDDALRKGSGSAPLFVEIMMAGRWMQLMVVGKEELLVQAMQSSSNLFHIMDQSSSSPAQLNSAF
ncbi:hypothetical protein GUJ93_ZPchr0006g45279 [Zizania palustris]|uniref:Uncharacterized protein n=1 Tax=Zizania palustris TaxID=103762 RepID=A0A8J5T1Y0_ZIZPA|nr:hypothetical protein GUJ93_ZPchr0006g45279 [Zizania palustris]